MSEVIDFLSASPRCARVFVFFDLVMAGTVKRPPGQGYGLVCDLDGRPIPDLIVADTRRSAASSSTAPAAKRLRYGSAE